MEGNNFKVGLTEPHKASEIEEDILLLCLAFPEF